MSAAITTHLVRRAMDPQMDPKLAAALKDLQGYRPPSWALPLLVLTTMGFGLIYGAVSGFMLRSPTGIFLDRVY